MTTLQTLSFWDIIGAIFDIAIVAYVLYRLFLLIRGTRAVPLIRGIIILLAATQVTRWLRLYTINWLLVKIQVPLLVALPIVFQPELRRALEQLGRGRIFSHTLANLGGEETTRTVNEVARATEVLSRNQMGALIVLERETGLSDIIEKGITIDGVVSGEFLVNIFMPNTPLHDGAVIIRGNRVLAASCLLPLSDKDNLSTELGTRHRAGLGVSEMSDALAVIVSEETGTISLANGGTLVRNLDGHTLREMLTKLMQPKPTSNPRFFGFGGRNHE
ncbi:MAG: diadenylate cyclase CdaA [Bacillota bacterium]